MDVSRLIRSPISSKDSPKSSKGRRSRVSRLWSVFDKDFGGPIGALFLIVTLPAFAYYLNLLGRRKPPVLSASIRPPKSLVAYYDPTAYLVCFGWFFAHLLFSLLPVGRRVEGRPLADGRRLSYRCNGVHALAVSLAAFAALRYWGVPTELLHLRRLALIVGSVILSFLVSLSVYLLSFRAPPTALSPQGSTGCTVYDFFMGRELNPRVCGVELKLVCELRPGLIAWALVDLDLLLSAWAASGAVNWPLGFVVAGQIIYVADALYFESAIISTLDVTYEGFGFMLAFGDLVWVPFVYSLPALCIAKIDRLPCAACLLPLVALFGVGYFIFRASNLQKDRFRTDEAYAKGCKSIATGHASGRRILCDGWWAWLRHPNYLGDLLMALSWGLAAGFHYALPYFYTVFLGWLLVTRALRDDRLCLRKYGTSWNEYRRRTPYRIFPRVW